MNTSKIRRKTCVCNIFFTVFAAIAAFASLCETKCQPLSDILPFLQTATGATLPIEPLLPSNPALLIDVKSCSMSASFSPSPFGISELGVGDAMTAHRISESWAGGAGAAWSGAQLFSDFHGFFLAATKIGSQFKIGSAIEYSRVSVRNYDVRQTILAHIGAVFHIDSAIVAAAAFGNVLRSSYGNSPIIRQEARFGFGIIATEQWSFDLDANIIEKASLEAGARFSPVPELKIRLGYSSLRQAVELFPAIGVADDIQIFSRVQWSNILGFSQQIGIARTL